MQVDIVGRVNNLQLPRTQPYIPLYECLVNSIEAMASLPSGSKHRIDVNVEHDVRQQSFKGIDDAASSIQNIKITDTGVGFNETNFQAFFLSDSTNKVSNGNKGIGRFTWLKVFEKASIISTYLDDREWVQRSFDFLGVSGILCKRFFV